jgi:hypothetical protein
MAILKVRTIQSEGPVPWTTHLSFRPKEKICKLFKEFINCRGPIHVLSRAQMPRCVYVWLRTYVGTCCRNPHPYGCDGVQFTAWGRVHTQAAWKKQKMWDFSVSIAQSIANRCYQPRYERFAPHAFNAIYLYGYLRMPLYGSLSDADRSRLRRCAVRHGVIR